MKTRRRTPQRRRWVRWSATAAALLGILAVANMIAGGIAAANILRGKTALEEAKTAIADADLPAARQAFEDAQSAFSNAHGGVVGLTLRAGGLVPWLGNTSDTVADVAAAGDGVSTAGAEMTAALEQIPGGLEGLTLQGGKIPLDSLSMLAGPAQRAQDEVDAAVELLDGVPRSLVPGPLTSAVDESRLVVREGANAVRGVSQTLAALPDYLGANGPRTYVVAAQNPTELRGTGGLIGEVALLRVDDGKISLGRFHNIKEIERSEGGPELNKNATYTPEDAIAADAEIPAFYDQRSIELPVYSNLTPRAAQAASYLIPHVDRTFDTSVDGVIYITPQVLPYLLEVTGPVPSRKLGVVLNEGNVVRYTTNEVYGDFDSTEVRKEALGEAAHEIWNALLAEPKGDRLIRALTQAVASGSLVLTSTTDAEQVALEAAGVGGQWGPPGAGWDFAGIAASNEAGNKVDYYLRSRAEYDVVLQPDGSALTTATITIHNGAPKGAKPSYVMGPFEGSAATRQLKPGTDILKVAQHCKSECILEEATVDGKPDAAHVEKDGSTTILGLTVKLLPQQTAKLEYRYQTVDAWQVEYGRGVYRLRIAMPQTISPFDVDASITVPDGTSVLWTIPEMTVAGATAQWSGRVLKSQDLEVVFDKGFMGKVLDQL